MTTERQRTQSRLNAVTEASIEQMLARAGNGLVWIDPREDSTTLILLFLNAVERAEALDRRLEKLFNQTKEPCCLHEIWTKEIGGKEVAFGFLNYFAFDHNEQIEHGNEIVLSYHKARVKAACGKTVEWIWMPRMLLADRADWARDPSLVTRLA